MLMGGLSSTMDRLSGFYGNISLGGFIFCDLTNILYVLIAVFFIKTGYENGVVKPSKLKWSKIFLVVIMLIQYNLLLYMAPIREFWTFSFLFTIVTGLFLDSKVVFITGLEITVSLLVSWMVDGDAFLPVKDEIYQSAIINRILCLVLTMAFIYLIVRMVSRHLIGAKKEELEKNNERVQNVLNKVMHIAGELGGASQALVGTAQAESASTQQLFAISENLLEHSGQMMDKSEQSRKNLLNLEESSRNMELKMQDVNRISKELTEISASNEKSLNLLMGMSRDVESSTGKTKEVTDKLLADNTKESLLKVGEVVNRVQGGTHDVSAFMSQNAHQLMEQNQVILKTVEAIDEAEEIRRIQNGVIQGTVEINEDIAGRIHSENEEFTNIADMVQSNKEEILELSQQVGTINSMVEELEKLLVTES